MRLDAEEMLKDIVVANTPYMKEDDRRRLVDLLQEDSRDILDQSDQHSTIGIAELKKFFEGK